MGGQTLVFRSELEASPSNYNHANSACVPLVINEPEVECEGDIQIVAIDSSVNPGNNEFGYTIEVTACTDIENLKIQGGSNGWAEIDNFIRDPLNLGDLDVKELKKNTVYSWKIDSLSENDMVTFEVQMHSLKDISCGQTVQLNGGWSVAYNLPADNAKYKTGYTTPLTWTNDCS